jgi:hypothetical protein
MLLTWSYRAERSNERTAAVRPEVTVGEEQAKSLGGFNSQSQRAEDTIAAILIGCRMTRGEQHGRREVFWQQERVWPPAMVGVRVDLVEAAEARLFLSPTCLLA